MRRSNSDADSSRTRTSSAPTRQLMRIAMIRTAFRCMPWKDARCWWQQAPPQTSRAWATARVWASGLRLAVTTQVLLTRRKEHTKTAPLQRRVKLPTYRHVLPGGRQEHQSGCPTRGRDSRRRHPRALQWMRRVGVGVDTASRSAAAPSSLPPISAPSPHIRPVLGRARMRVRKGAVYASHPEVGDADYILRVIILGLVDSTGPLTGSAPGIPPLLTPDGGDEEAVVIDRIKSRGCYDIVRSTYIRERFTTARSALRLCALLLHSPPPTLSSPSPPHPPLFPAIAPPLAPFPPTAPGYPAGTSITEVIISLIVKNFHTARTPLRQRSKSQSGSARQRRASRVGGRARVVAASQTTSP